MNFRNNFNVVKKKPVTKLGCEKHEVAKYIVENQNVLAKDVAVIFTEKFAKPLTADTVRRIKSEGIYQKLKLAFPRSGPEYT